MGIKSTKRRFRAAFLLIVAAFGSFGCVWAQKRINVPQGFPTIQRALAEAVEGDTVYVRRGVYYENITLADDVILMGEDRKNTIIDGRRRGPVVTAADGAVITGFTIRNGTTGILCKNTRPIITDNLIMDNKGTGVHALVVLPDIINNVIYRNEWTGIFLESARGTRTSINHNVIMENGYSGIFGAGHTEVLIRNNDIYGNRQYGVFLGPGARRTRIVGNNIFANRLAVNENADNPAMRQQNISADPQFAGPGFPSHNYTVRATSPNKGRGEEGADIGLSADVKPATAPAPVRAEGPSELDQFFGGQPAGEQQVIVSEPESFARAEQFTAEEPRSFAETPQPQYAEPPPSQATDMFGRPVESQPDPAPEVAFAQPPQPAASVSPITEPMVLHGLNFMGFESTDITHESYPVLDAIADLMNQFPSMRVEIAGFANNQDREDLSRQLSHRRAGAVRDYLTSRGIDRGRLSVRGYGMERPIDSEGQSNPNRIEIVPTR